MASSLIRSQKVLIAVTLAVIPVVLHTTFCEWHWKAVNLSQRRILAAQHGEKMARPGSRSRRYDPYTGLFAQRDTHDMAVLFGVVVPTALLATNAVLLLGWRHQRAIAHGRCPACGYDMRGSGTTPAVRCTECGWARRDHWR